MKKMFFALILGVLVVAALGTVVYADNGPHGSFTASTDACASCHRAHSAKYGNNGLLIASPEAVCLECHDGTGAGTNVLDGVYVQAGSDAYYQTSTSEGMDGASLFGGGFENAVMATTWTGGEFTSGTAATSKATTSHHTFDGTTGTVWGSGATNASVNTGGSYSMECVSCHDPHGNSGYYDGSATSPITFYNFNAMLTFTKKTASYRLLRWQPSGSDQYASKTGVNWVGGALKSNGTTTGWLIPDNYTTSGTEWYTIGKEPDISKCGQSGTSACGAPFAIGDYAAGTGNIVYLPDNASGTQVNYVNAAVNLPYFCAQCHDRYLANSSLRNGTDQSAYCGAPQAKTLTSGLVLTVYAPVSGLHPVDPTGCILSGDSLSWFDVRSSGDGQFTFMHSSGELRQSVDLSTSAPTSTTGTSVKRSCVACHVSHGTTAVMTDFAKASTLSSDSSLLRMDNRSMCLRCHASTVGFTVLPTPTATTGP
jgi:predicted CXXCH cytochrome family protein